MELTFQTIFCLFVAVVFALFAYKAFTSAKRIVEDEPQDKVHLGVVARLATAAFCLLIVAGFLSIPVGFYLAGG